MKKTKFLLPLLCTAILLAGCKHNNGDDDTPPHVPTTVGMFILSEGSFNGNNSTMSYCDLSDTSLVVDYFAAQNNGTKLGDTATDLEIYGSKLYTVVNVSNKVIVTDVATGKILSEISMGQADGTDRGPRYVTCGEAKVYVSLWSGEVARIDTTTFAVDYAALSGAFCEGIAISGKKLYVANSGNKGDFYGGQGTVVSVVDLASFKETKTITTVANPNRMATAENGDVYFTTWGNYADVDAQLHRIDPAKDIVSYTFPDVAVGKFALCGDYAYTTHFSYITFESSVKKINLKTNSVEIFLADEPIMYDVSADVKTGDIFYLNEGGDVTCYNNLGVEQYKLPKVGLRPNSIAFWVK